MIGDLIGDLHKRSQRAEPEVTDMAGACEFTKLSKSTINRLVRSGKLKKVKVGKRTLFGYDELRKMLHAST